MPELTDADVLDRELTDEDVLGPSIAELSDSEVGIEHPENVSAPPDLGAPQLSDRNIVKEAFEPGVAPTPKPTETSAIEGLMGAAEKGIIAAQQVIPVAIATEAQEQLEIERLRSGDRSETPVHRQKNLGVLSNPVSSKSNVPTRIRTPEERAETLRKAQEFRDIWTSVVSDYEKEKDIIPKSKAQQELAAAKSSGDKWGVFKKYPIQTISSIVLESLPPSIAGASVGALAGPPGMVAGVGASSWLAEFSNGVIQGAAEAGYDPADADQLVKFLDSPAFENVISTAKSKATLIAGFDAATAGFAGRFIEPALKEGLKQVLVASGKEVALQAAGGAAGEFAAQTATKGDKPYDWFDISMEAMAEVFTGPIEAFGNIRDKIAANGAAVSDSPNVSKIEEMLNEQAAASVAPKTTQAKAESAQVIPVPVETEQPIGGEVNEVDEERRQEEGLQVAAGAAAVPTAPAAAPKDIPSLAEELQSLWPELGSKTLYKKALLDAWNDKLRKAFEALPADRQSQIDGWFDRNEKVISDAEDRQFASYVINELRSRARVGDKAGFTTALFTAIRSGGVHYGLTARQWLETAASIVKEPSSELNPSDMAREMTRVYGEVYGSDAAEMLSFLRSQTETPVATESITPQTITGSNEQTGSEMPVQSEAGASVSAPSEAGGVLSSAIDQGEQSIGDKIRAAIQSGPEEGRAYKSATSNRGGWTAMMWDIGAQAKTPEDVAVLRSAAEESVAKSKAMIESAKEPGISEEESMKRLMAAAAEAGKQPMEAYEFATGVKLDGTPKWSSFERLVPGYKPPVPDEAYIKAKASETEASTLASEIEPPEGESGGNRDVFGMSDEELGKFFDEQFGSVAPTGRVGEFGRRGMFSFGSYQEFEKWMNSKYDARDIESMRLAFAEASTEFKKQFIKANRSATDHKKAWVAHLATGAVLPTEDPPISGGVKPEPEEPTAGEPPPPSEGEPPSGAPPAAPSEPRSPSRRVRFDFMAMTQLLRQFSNVPEINARLTKAYGQYVTKSGKVQLMQRLLWDRKLAERVLAHEAGHFVDLFLSPKGSGLPFADRLSPLRDFRHYMPLRDSWRKEAVALSRAWRGPFSAANKYRNSSEELFADFMSAMMNNPEWVNQNFPILHDAFAELLAGKGDFRAAYEEMTRWLEGGTVVKEWRDQQGEADERTSKELLAEKKKHVQSIPSYLKTAFMSVWADAWGKEKVGKDVGGSKSEDLEYSSMWAAGQNALFADSVISKVYPLLRRVSDKMSEARSYLHQYSQALRTIGERKMAGLWIENNPNDARPMLAHIANLDPILSNKYLQSIHNAPDSALYDIAAEMFREIHDRGDKFVSRIESEIDNLGLGVKGEEALLAFNVRGKMLNPGGLTADRAQQVIDEIKAELGPDKFKALDGAATELRDLLYETQSKAHDEGLISDSTWNNLIVPNRNNYVPYAVLDHWGGRVGAGVRPQKGTAKDIASTLFAVEMKTAMLNVWRQRQRQVRLLIDVYSNGGAPVTVGKKLVKPQDLESIRASHRDDDVSRAVIWKDGAPHLVEFPENPGKTFEKAMDSRAFYQYLEPLAKLSGIGHSIMQLYTTLSLPFMIYRNPVRGAKTAAGRIGFTRIGKELAQESYGLLQALAATVDPNATSISNELGYSARLALNYARAAFGEPMLPEVRDLIDRQILLPPRLSQAMVRNPDNLSHLLENGGILAFQVQKAKSEGWPLWAKLAPTREAVKFAEEVFTAYEAFEKIYNLTAAKEKGASPEKSAGIARRSGIPNPGVGGYLTMPIELFFPWTRVKIQGLRSSLDIAKDPDFGKGFLTRFAITEAIPRMAKVAIGFGLMAGVVKWATGNDDEDENDPVMAEVIRRISPYKLALDDVVPLMFYDSRTGKYHYFNEFKSGKSIPAHYEVVSLRIPSSEEGRTFGPLIHQMMANSPLADKKLGAPGDNIMSALGSWVKTEMAPNPSPAIETGKNLYRMLFLGENPDDPFRKQPSANKEMFDAGWGSGRGQAIAGYTLNQLGFAGDVAGIAAMNFGLLDQKAISSLKKRVAGDKVPIQERMVLIKNMLSYDNYAQYRDEQNSKIEEEARRARAKMSLSTEARAIYDFYYRNVGRQDKLDIFGKRRFVIAKDFSERWGKASDPWSLYAKAIAASNPKASEMSRETAKRDLNLLTAPYIARWNILSLMSE